jgi:hypothetical protein
MDYRYLLLSMRSIMGLIRSYRGRDEARCRLCYDQHHVWMVTVGVLDQYAQGPGRRLWLWSPRKASPMAHGHLPMSADTYVLTYAPGIKLAFNIL